MPVVLSVAFTLVAANLPVNIVATLPGDDLMLAGIVADIVERPSAIGDAEFADRLVQAEGLRQRNPGQAEPERRDRGPLFYRSVWAGDGRNVVVYYAAEGASAPAGRVCRIRAVNSGFSTARYRAYRWCAASFGIATPETAPSPVASISPKAD